MFRYIRSLFHSYDVGHEYWVNIDEIQIIPQFKESKPGFEKMMEKLRYYKRTGNFQTPIKLMRNFTLVDGYTTYLICQQHGLDKVPVYFVD